MKVNEFSSECSQRNKWREKKLSHKIKSKLFSFFIKESSIFHYNEQIQEIGAFHNGYKSFCKINFDVVILDLKIKGAKKFKLVTHVARLL